MNEQPRLYYVASTTDDGDYESLLRSLLPAGEKLCVIGTQRAVGVPSTLGRLEPMREFLLGEDQVAAWPGTALSDGSRATSYTFEFSDASLASWFRLVDRLFSEVKLGFEDLHIVRGPGTPVFASISSHATAWLQMDSEEFESWQTRAPENVRRLLTEANQLPGHVTPLGALAGSTHGGSLSASDVGSLVGQLPDAIRDHLADYLRHGDTVIPWPGETNDSLGNRFRVDNGAEILTDGRYFWRKDAADYVREYSIGVPQEALDHFHSLNWTHRPIADTEIEEISNYLWS